MIKTKGMKLPESRKTDIQDSYKYLVIPQANGNPHEDAMRPATAKFLQRVRQTLRSQLNRNKSQAINMYALPVNRYLAGIVSWPHEEIDVTDVNTRKLLNIWIYGWFDSKSSTLRL